MDEPETHGHSVRSLILAIEKSVQKTLGDLHIKFEDIFDYIIMPEIPERVKADYKDMIKEEKASYLNEEGGKMLLRAKNIEQMIDIVRNENFQSKKTIRGLEFGSIKLDKILPANPFTIADKDYKFLAKRGINILKISSSDAFFRR